MASPPNPLTGVCLVSEKTRVPSGFEPILRAHDDPTFPADVWKDGMFAMTRTVRLICTSRAYQPGTFTFNVVADVAIANDRSAVPPGFLPLEFTEDTRERALRKKILCIRTVPRESAVDAVCDLILCRSSKAPPGFTLVGDIDDLRLCIRHAPIPAEFRRPTSFPALYPNQQLPYPIHPSNSANANFAGSTPLPGQVPQHVPLANGGRQMSSPSSRSLLDGLPFELNARMRLAMTEPHERNGIADGLAGRKPSLLSNTDESVLYSFSLEQSVLRQQAAR